MSAKTVVITGALSGIGEKCAIRFAAENYSVIISGRNSDKGQTLLKELGNITTNKIKYIYADISNESDVISLARQSEDFFGKVDVVLNVAGTEGNPSTYESSTVEDFHKVFNTNVLGTQLIMKHFLPAMCQRQYGTVINFSSQAGQVGIPGGSVYSASKHAVNGLTRSVALEVASTGVRVNAIAPGPVDTDMFDRFVGRDKQAKAAFLSKMPNGKITTTCEIADTALFLASDSAKSIVGQIITVDGGYSVG
ncbi:SDR family oxidoreductase [Serratia marcescens]|nr:SDR family oxidoreductase [Serratia marcescens]